LNQPAEFLRNTQSQGVHYSLAKLGRHWLTISYLQSVDGPFLDISGSPPKLGGNLDPKLPPPPFNDTDFSAIPYRSSSITEGGKVMRWVCLDQTPSLLLWRTSRTKGPQIEFLANPFKFDTGLMLPQGLFLKFGR